MSEYIPVSTLTQRWEEARTRTFVARHTHEDITETVDYWTELRLGAQISREVLAGRWVVVAELLRADGVKSWAQVSQALGLTEIEAHDGFTGWIAGQLDLYRRTGSLGLTEAAAERLYELAEAVTL